MNENIKKIIAELNERVNNELQHQWETNELLYSFIKSKDLSTEFALYRLKYFFEMEKTNGNQPQND